MSNLDSSDHRTLFQFETVHFKLALAHMDTTALLDHVHKLLSFCMIELLVGICRWHGGLCLPAVVSGSIPWPISNVNDRIMPMSDAVSSEGPKTTGIQQRSSALSLTHRDFSSFSECLMMLCTVDDEICKALQFDVEETLFLKYSTIFLRTLSQIGEHLPIFTSERTLPL